MPDTFQALFVTALAILPGGLYTWYFEREVGAWGAKASDRIPRLIGSSAVFLALYAYPAYLIWTHYLHHRVTRGDMVTYENRVWQGDALPWWLFLVPVAYVALPILLGWLSAHAVIRSRQSSWKGWRVIVAATAGRDPAPRAWDYFFLKRPVATVRIRLTDDDGWVGGRFGAHSYAAGYGEDPQDLLLERAYAMEGDGRFVSGTDPGGYRELGSSVLVPFERVVHMEFFE